ncbi:hypothetical protein KIW84_042934 [Lathyrus oleraceus]|uniref:Transposase MuDR plant domain-containing protein n=1 Tax=Pisum sativum TaxID=3888 RepID=A0A9D4XDR0_PEA|nr:hypothetical protein KIW84_042934 [Pisum sativum]
MEFFSLKQFKDAILEHNILNSRDVRFEKNDANKCRMVCKDSEKCNYIILCSIVLTSTTFRTKTLFAKHKRGRQFFNKSANAEWVAKVIVGGLKNNTKMKLSEVVADVRLGYAIEIPIVELSKTWKNIHAHATIGNLLGYHVDMVWLQYKKNKWTRTSNPIMLPPLLKHGPGRPKKLRMRELDEANQTKWQRTNTRHRCKTCFKLGHNKRTCKKNKQIVLVPSGNAAHASQEMPTHASQEMPIQFSQKMPTQASQTRPQQKDLAQKKANDVDTFAGLLGDDDVLEIQPLSVEKSHIKPTESKSGGVKVLFGKQPKVYKNKPFKAS